MPFIAICPACTAVEPRHKLVTVDGAPNVIECLICHATFNRFMYAYAEDPAGDMDDEIESFFLDDDFREDNDFIDPADGYGIPGHWA